MSDYNKFIELIRNSNRIVFFGGAGVSTESGIPDFRSVDGLYQLKYKHSPETILSHTFLKKFPNDFFEFYKDKVLHIDAMPNKAHFALAKLEAMDKLTTVITQNIDGLHQKAGSKNVYELHGSVHKNYCDDCGTKYEVRFVLESKDNIPYCTICGGVVRPDVVLYEEGLDMTIIEKAIDDISDSDLLIIGGTSLVVQPAASLIRYHKKGRIVLINKGETPADKMAYLKFNESIGEIFEKVMNDI